MDNKSKTAGVRRSSGRTVFQEEQKRATRGKLIAAASSVFAEKGYAAAAVDDILKGAEVSRGAFYAHFQDKFAVYEVLYEELRAPAYAIFERLAQLDDPSTEQIEEWLGELVNSARTVADILVSAIEVAAIEPTFNQGQFEFGIELLGILGKGIPAFKLATTNTMAGKEAMVRATMLLLQISSITHSIIVGQKWIDPAIAIKVLAQEIHRFIHSDTKKMKDATKKIRTTKKR